ncbi:MAG TPA: NYN domain-containing protein [Longimicrobiaceae bacterium]|nr:NYN domain-containing protein [Longimicrobiaceae bacterium]
MTYPHGSAAAPHQRVAIFIDGWNFRYATYESFGLRVDYTKLLRYFSEGAILVRAYFYTGEWDDSAISRYVGLSNPPDPYVKRREMEQQRDGERAFWRFLNRNGYRVVRKPVRVVRDEGEDVSIKADLDLELAIDMLTLADKVDRIILVSGDGDFVPLVDAVAKRGVRVAVVSTQSEDAFRNARYRASDDLLDAADEFIPIESIRRYIEREPRSYSGIRREPREGGEEQGSGYRREPRDFGGQPPFRREPREYGYDRGTPPFRPDPRELGLPADDPEEAQPPSLADES